MIYVRNGYSIMYELLRQKMVQKYVIDVGVNDQQVISAMLSIPRHLFVEGALDHQAYKGGSIPIGYGQTISHPTTVAIMSQILEISGEEKILEIGTGSGYQAAVLAEMGAKVFTIERIPELADRAQKLLSSLGYYSVAIRTGDGSLGWSEHAPYDRIIVTAGSPVLPDSLIEQLANEGKLIIPVGDRENQNLHIISKVNGELTIQKEKWRRFVPLIGRKGWHL